VEGHVAEMGRGVGHGSDLCYYLWV
jgi:hypothetical protein